MGEVLARVFASAQGALERDLEKTTLGDLVDCARRSETCARTEAG
jgi:hypothetical protein